MHSACSAGSLPGGVTAEQCAAWIEKLHQQGKKVLFDSSKAALRAGIDLGRHAARLRALREVVELEVDILRESAQPADPEEAEAECASHHDPPPPAQCYARTREVLRGSQIGGRPWLRLKHR